MNNFIAATSCTDNVPTCASFVFIFTLENKLSEQLKWFLKTSYDSAFRLTIGEECKRNIPKYTPCFLFFQTFPCGNMSPVHNTGANAVK